MRKIKNLPLKIGISIAVVIYAVILYFTPINCPILELTGVSCLGCGMSRALFSAVTLDFSTAFSRHFMFWSVPLLYGCFLADGRLFKSKKLNIIFYTVIVIGFILNWIYHQFL